jgi:hypothetical protein
MASELSNCPDAAHNPSSRGYANSPRSVPTPPQPANQPPTTCPQDSQAAALQTSAPARGRGRHSGTAPLIDRFPSLQHAAVKADRHESQKEIEDRLEGEDFQHLKKNHAGAAAAVADLDIGNL